MLYELPPIFHIMLLFWLNSKALGEDLIIKQPNNLITLRGLEISTFHGNETGSERLRNLVVTIVLLPHRYRKLEMAGMIFSCHQYFQLKKAG